MGEMEEEIPTNSRINHREQNILCRVCEQTFKVGGFRLTIIGVMRFLQTEWHRHERDRNGWEIERQEMKGRIAKLEGMTRKLDSSNNSLKKYVSMLEKALKERDTQVKALKAGNASAANTAKEKESASGGRPKQHRKSNYIEP